MGTRAERNWSCHGLIHLCALPCNSRQPVYGAAARCQEQELHETAWQCMMDGVVHSWHFIAGKLVTITQAPGNSFNMQQTSISIENIIYLSCLHVQHLSFLFSLSLHSDWHRGPNTHNPAAFTTIMHTLSTSTNTFVPLLHAPKHKQWTCWQTVQCRLQ